MRLGEFKNCINRYRVMNNERSLTNFVNNVSSAERLFKDADAPDVSVVKKIFEVLFDEFHKNDGNAPKGRDVADDVFVPFKISIIYNDNTEYKDNYLHLLPYKLIEEINKRRFTEDPVCLADFEIILGGLLINPYGVDLSMHVLDSKFINISVDEQCSAIVITGFVCNGKSMYGDDGSFHIRKESF